MASAGYCARCGANVWLLGDGSCQHGHPSSDVSGVYNAPIPTEAADLPSSPRKSRKTIIMFVALALVVCLGIIGALLVVARPLASRGIKVAGEWQSRLQDDYPGWKVIGFNSRSFTGDEGTESQANFTLIPPGRDFSVVISYLSADGAEFELQDEVLRPGGRFHAHAGRLLDAIKTKYIDEHKLITSVTSDEDGSVTVDWLRVKRFGPFTSRFGSYDTLDYDEDADEWLIIHTATP